MAGPNKPNNQKNNKNNDNKKKTSLSFLSIALWAVVIVLLFNTCTSSMRSSANPEVEYSTFREWVVAGYVEEVDMGANAYYFTVKPGTPPLDL